MVRVYRRLMADQVTAFAALTDDLTVAVLGRRHSPTFHLPTLAGVDVPDLQAAKTCACVSAGDMAFSAVESSNHMRSNSHGSTRDSGLPVGVVSVAPLDGKTCRILRR